MTSSEPPPQQPSWWSQEPAGGEPAASAPGDGRPDEQPTQPVPAAWQAPGDTLGSTGPARRPVGLLVAGAVVLALVAGLLGGAAGAWWQGRAGGGTNRAVTLPAPAPGTTARPAGSVAGVASAVLPSVVAIQVTGADGAGTGSGFVIRSDGYIVTNNHVVAGAAGGGSI